MVSRDLSSVSPPPLTTNLTTFHNLFTTYPQPIHNLFTTYSQPIHNLFTTYFTPYFTPSKYDPSND